MIQAVHVVNVDAEPALRSPGRLDVQHVQRALLGKPLVGPVVGRDNPGVELERPAPGVAGAEDEVVSHVPVTAGVDVVVTRLLGP